jgi:acetyl esterase/lipase
MLASTTAALATALACSCEVATADESTSPAVTRGANGGPDLQAGEPRARHLNTRSTLGELLRHPAFAGYARRLLPRDDVPIDETLPIARIDTLLPYHSHVVPEVVVGALNHLIDEVGRGTPVFHELYAPAEKQTDPTKASTGLVFFRGRPGAPFALIAPGGGFSYVGSVHEGFPYALEISRQGYNAFVLRYRVGQGGSIATEDMAAAIAYIFRHAGRLGIGTAHYSLWGSSAGARMAAAIGSQGVGQFGGGELPGPGAVVMAYTGHSDVAAHEPPTFAVVGEQDAIAPPSVMVRRVNRLRAQNTTVELHRYPNLGHGFGLGTGTSADGWARAAIRFWERSMSKR